METLNKNIMPHKITYVVEMYLATLTMISTMIAGNFLIDLLLGVLTYTSARLFYHYFGGYIKKGLGKIKKLIKR